MAVSVAPEIEQLDPGDVDAIPVVLAAVCMSSQGSVGWRPSR
jgi:hypothetical protein